MSDNPKCEYCHYSFNSPINKDTLQTDLLCMRYPPKITVIQPLNGAVSVMTLFPRVETKMFCGEFKPNDK